MPALSASFGSVESGGDTSRVSSVSYSGSGAGHTHSLDIFNSGEHAHGIDLPLPPYASIIPLMYVGVS